MAATGTPDESAFSEVEIEMTEEQHHDWLERQVSRRMEGMSLNEFVEAYEAGTVTDADPDVPFLVGLIGLGQQRDRVPA